MGENDATAANVLAAFGGLGEDDKRMVAEVISRMDDSPRDWHIPVGDGRCVRLWCRPMTPSQWENMLGVLSAMRPALASLPEDRAVIASATGGDDGAV